MINLSVVSALSNMKIRQNVSWWSTHKKDKLKLSMDATKYEKYVVLKGLIHSPLPFLLSTTFSCDLRTCFFVFFGGGTHSSSSLHVSVVASCSSSENGQTFNLKIVFYK